MVRTRNGEVMGVSELRANLTKTIAGMREEPERSVPVVLGSHRKPDAAIVPYAQYQRLIAAQASDSGPAPRVLDALHAKTALISRLAAMNNIGDVLAFGSVARGEEADSSDIDLMVDTTPGATYFDVAQFAMDMEQLMGRPVDAVPIAALDKRRDRAVFREAVSL